jgi:hydrogenase/urease accessory protein HupE
MSLVHSLRKVAGAAVVIALAFTGVAQAHDPGLSTARLAVVGESLRVTLSFARRDVDSIQSIPTESAQARVPGGLEALVRKNVVVKMNGRPTPVEAVAIETDANDNVEIHLDFAHSNAAHIKLEMPLIRELPFGHRQVVTLLDARGGVVEQRMLSAAESTFDGELHEGGQSVSQTARFETFLAHGVRHILEGYDHLLFLFGILLVLPSFLSALRVISCFSLAHSLTLTAAVLGSFRVPSQVVEPLIAASIVYVGAENLLRGGRFTHRGFLTFGFGLVHGLGFATALRDMQIGSGAAMVLPLVSFNLGVELGQIAVAALVLPAILWLQRDLRFAQHWAPACSVLITIMGGCWLVERTL